MELEPSAPYREKDATRKLSPKRNFKRKITYLASGPQYIEMSEAILLEENTGTLKNKRQKCESTPFYNNDHHPLTSAFWKALDLSDRLKAVVQYVNEHLGKQELQKNNIINIVNENHTYLIHKLHISPENNSPIPNFPSIEYKDLIITYDKSRNADNGNSGAEVCIIYSTDPNCKVAVKKFKDTKKGLEELFFLLFSIKLFPDKTKMARVYDAVICPGNCLSIIMELANTHDIHHFLSTPYAEDVVKASAEYLATLHLMNGKKLTDDKQKEKYINFASDLFFRLLYNPFKEKPNMPDFLSLSFKKQEVEYDKVTSKNIMRLLSPKQQELFVKLVTETCRCFEENCGKIFRSEVPYFLTMTHGDIHGNNLFYDDSDVLTTQHGTLIGRKSLFRVTAIDYGTASDTWGKFADSTNDVGRFIGSLWDWAAQKKSENLKKFEEVYSDQKISILERHFIDRYIKTVKKSNIFPNEDMVIFTKIFKENFRFHKLRFLKAVWNSEKSSEIKKTTILSWIKQNVGLQNSPPSRTPIKTEIICNLPVPPEEFIERINKETGTSYLRYLETTLAEHSSVGVIGQGGVGKTSLVLQYAYKVTGYDLIWFFISKIEDRLLKGYKDLLLELKFSTQEQQEHEIILEFKKAMSIIAKRERCLLIYDDVPTAGCLQKWLPENNENIHILCTSRAKRGWKQPCIIFDVFSPEESKNYISKVTGLKLISENESILEKFSEELGHLPLALSHAAHYIKLEAGEKVTKNNFITYLENLKKAPHIHFEKHENPFKNESKKINYGHLVYKPYDSKVYNTQLDHISLGARVFMGYNSYLDPLSIEEEIFAHMYCPLKMEKILSELALNHFIKRPNKGRFSISPFLQLLIRNKEESINMGHVKFPTIARIFIERFRKKTSTNQSIDVLLSDFPHILKLITHSERLTRSLLTDNVESLKWIGRVLAILKEKENLSKENIVEYDKILLNNFANERLPTWLKTNAHLEVELALFHMYDKGLFVSKNAQEAYHHYNLAVQKGAAEVEFYLRNFYSMQPLQHDKRIKWFAKAASQGNKTALNSLLEYANNGSPQAQFKLGSMYSDGWIGAGANINEALKWFRKAAEQGHELATIQLKYCLHISQ